MAWGQFISFTRNYTICQDYVGFSPESQKNCVNFNITLQAFLSGVHFTQKWRYLSFEWRLPRGAKPVIAKKPAGNPDWKIAFNKKHTPTLIIAKALKWTQKRDWNGNGYFWKKLIMQCFGNEPIWPGWNQNKTCAVVNVNN